MDQANRGIDRKVSRRLFGVGFRSRSGRRMVDQTQMTGTEKPTNGRSESPPRAVARNTAEFLHDLTTLAELQGKLLLIDCQQGLRKLLVPIVTLLVGLTVAVGCVPVALAALAVALVETTELSLAASLGVAVLSGLVLAAVFTTAAYLWLRDGFTFLERSYYEWGRNRLWAKDMLKRLSQISKPQPSLRTTTY
jgi:hypothetical protein